MSRNRPLPVPITEVPFVLDLRHHTPPFSWSGVFGRNGPVELEIGSGKGMFLLEASRLNPGVNFLGVERAGKWFHRCVERVLRSGRGNLRLTRHDAFDLLQRWVPEHSLSAVHIYFPDPWPKKKHAGRRLFQPALFGMIARALRPGAPLLLASDLLPYFADAEEQIAALGLFDRVDWPADAPDRLPTHYAIKWDRMGRTLSYGKFIRKPPR